MSLAALLNLSVLSVLGDEAGKQGTLVILAALALAAFLLRVSRSAPDLRSRMQFCTLLTGLHVLLLPAVAIAAVLDAGIARDMRLTGSIVGALAGVGLSGLLVFGMLLPRLRLEVPRLLQDIAVATLATVAVFGTASRAGVNLSGIVATGAVLTAVIGLALQDTLGNVVGGLSLQLDATIREDDWIRVQEVTGRVVEIRWRSTSIETRNWETVILPNSLLTKTQVTVLGRRTGQDRMWRRWVYFNVDYRFPPSQVIELVKDVLRSRPIENVSETPPIDCILMEFGESAGRYAVRYWLTNLAIDDPTDSVVRTRIYFALTRAEIPLSMPAHAVFLTEDSLARREYKRGVELDRRIAALSRIDLFHDLSESERAELAGYL
ncbi:MAG TPA: mechanosensitive ion channel domain-containing protein, partial [Polyangiales bacterium]